jgi:CubicO group peptidase (beta-lactamase class C family)
MQKYRLRNFKLIGPILIPAILLFFVFQPSIPAQDEEYTEAIKVLEQYIAKQLGADRIPGLSIAFFKDDFVWAKGFGYADLENRVPATAESAYRLASVSKSMTALAALKLAEEGKLDLDADVRTYVPFFPGKKWPVNARQLMGHLGGISHYRDYDKEGFFTTHYDTKESVDVFADWELEAEPGTKFIYSSYGYNLLGAVVEGASGEPFGKYVTENVWKPLGMDSTRLDSPDEIIPNRVRGYRSAGDKVMIAKFVDISSRFGAGGTRSTVLDLLKYARGVIESKVLSKEYSDTAFDSMATKDGRYTFYGCGWSVTPYAGFFTIAHSGGQQETSTYLFVLPNENFAVAVAANFDAPTYKFVQAAASAVMGLAEISVEVPNEADGRVYRGLQMAWRFGLARQDRCGKPLSSDAGKLAEAFKYFNDAVNRSALEKDLDGVGKKIEDGVHPLTGEPLTVIGSYMAERLLEKHGPARLTFYRKNGGILFFRDYIRLYTSDGSIPAECRLTPELERTVEEWAAGWERVWTDEVRRYYFLSATDDLEGVAERLKELFAGASVYPRFNNQLNAYAYNLKKAGDIDKGLQTLLFAAELFPTDANLYDSIGEFYLAKDDKENAARYYAVALEKDPAQASSEIALAKINAPALTGEEMDALIGEYPLLPSLVVNVVRENEKLFAEAAGLGKLEMVAKSPQKFLVKAGREVYSMEFKKNKQGRAEKMTLVLSGPRND